MNARREKKTRIDIVGPKVNLSKEKNDQVKISCGRRLKKDVNAFRGPRLAGIEGKEETVRSWLYSLSGKG